MDERLMEINNSMATPTSKVDDMEKRLKELEFMGDFEELCEEVHAVANSMVANVNQEIQAFKASEAANDTKI